MFDKSLKKKLKLQLLQRMLTASGRGAGAAHESPLHASRCLLVSCGDNNGALNYHFRALGGSWTWAELEERGIPEMEAFLGDRVHAATPNGLPFPDETFDCVVVIDSHEHLDDPSPFNRELARVVRPGGRLVVTTPYGDERKLAVRLKERLGMTKERYGHCRWGYTFPELEGMFVDSGFRPTARGSYARLFTELLELVINFAYVKVLARRGPVPVADGVIVPSSEAQLRAVEKTYRLYARVYPFLWCVSQLDGLLVGRTGYAVAVAGEKRDGGRR
jgi:SAM-dependent methyltransferase